MQRKTKQSTWRQQVVVVVAVTVAACDGNSGQVEEGAHHAALQPSCGLLDAGSVEPDATSGSSHYECEVTLSKISYDTPGADDAELIELRITGNTEAGMATLHDCGVDSLELVNGEGAMCSVYRQIDLAQVTVPESGYVVICAAESRLAQSTTCDVVAGSGNTPLKNGWLQNGPSDGLRLVGAKSRAWSYEGVPVGCADDWVRIPTDTGAAIDGADDVIARCADGFARVSLSNAPLRGEAQCPLPEAGTQASTAPDRDAGDGGETSKDGASGGAAARGSIAIDVTTIDVPALPVMKSDAAATQSVVSEPLDDDASPGARAQVAALSAGCHVASGVLGYRTPSRGAGLGALWVLLLGGWRRYRLRQLGCLRPTLAPPRQEPAGCAPPHARSP